MSLGSFAEFCSVAGDSNIVNKTRFMLEKGKDKITDRDVLILELAVEYLNRILQALLFESEDIFTKNLKESIKTYKISRPALEKLNVGNLKKLIMDSKDELQSIKGRKKINKDEVNKNTLNLFVVVGKYLLHEGFKHLTEPRY